MKAEYIFKDATLPLTSGVHEIWVDAWWIVDAETGEQCFWRQGGHEYPQCNQDRRIPDRRAVSDHGRPVEVRLVPFAHNVHRCDP